MPSYKRKICERTNYLQKDLLLFFGTSKYHDHWALGFLSKGSSILKTLSHFSCTAKFLTT